MPSRPPTTEEAAAIQKIHEGYRELRQMGWQEPHYAPRQFQPFEVIELGSTGIHEAVHFDDDKSRTAWIDGDAPTRPLLIRRIK